MDRFAVFVDAGYLYAETGRLLFNTTDRRAIQLDGPGVIGHPHPTATGSSTQTLSTSRSGGRRFSSRSQIHPAMAQ